MFLALFLQAAAPPPEPVQAEPADIVVVARRSRCDVSIANRVISSREFNDRAAEWAAGVPVRVHAPGDASLKCLTRIMFRLADKGITRVEFVE